MSLKAVLFDFNGVIVKDESIHQELIKEILLGENLRPSLDEYRQICLGRSDRACLREILSSRGRIVTDNYLDILIKKKASAYRQQIETWETLPLYPGLKTILKHIRSLELVTGIVSGTIRSEIEELLEKAELTQYFDIIISGDDLSESKPDPKGYLLAVEQLNQTYPTLNLRPGECLAIEDTPSGITAAKKARMQVVGVANTYPVHILQRQANWSVDYLWELELERVQEVFSTI